MADCLEMRPSRLTGPYASLLCIESITDDLETGRVSFPSGEIGA